MENYIVSARKYRPTTFESVVGQQALTQTLRNAIRTNHLAHAYLFCGPRGVGKTTCARIFAKTINCLNPTAENDACNQCESCAAFNEQRSFNIHELDAASNNGVDDIRALIDQVRIPPQIGKYSVYIRCGSVTYHFISFKNTWLYSSGHSQLDFDSFACRSVCSYTV